MRYKIAVGNAKFDIQVGGIQAGTAEVSVNGKNFQVSIENFAEVCAGKGSQEPGKAIPPQRSVDRPLARQVTPAAGAMSSNAAGGAVVAPIPGLILKINVKEGDTVKAGQVVAIMEAMKMENNISSSISGIVASIRASEGSQVTTGEVIMVIEP